jgi:hypothetical protein
MVWGLSGFHVACFKLLGKICASCM